MAITITIKVNDTGGIFLGTSYFFFVLFLNKLCEAIMKESYNIAWVYQNSQPPSPCTTVLSDRINTSG